MQLDDIEFEELVDHATTRRWGQNHQPTDYSKPYNIIAYCSERISQIPFQLSMPSLDEKTKEKILTRLNFLNGVMGRLASLEDQTLQSSSYSNFANQNIPNQIDLFLDKIGYKKQ